jgi:hypothetical protein
MNNIKWIIKDWAGNHLFQKYQWSSFDDAEYFLDEQLGDNYETDREEYCITTKEITYDKN